MNDIPKKRRRYKERERKRDREKEKIVRMKVGELYKAS